MFDTGKVVEVGALTGSSRSSRVRSSIEAGGPADAGGVAPIESRSSGWGVLGEIERSVAPTTLAADHRLPVLPALESVLPRGLQRGTTVGVSGVGSLSLALALLAGATTDNVWSAAVGCDDLCLAAVDDAGIPMHRFVTVTQPSRSLWSTVVSALLDSFGIVLVAPSARVSTSDARRLRARARERGSVLVDTTRMWPESHDLSMTVTSSDWMGLGRGHGALEARRITVEVVGRRGVAPRSIGLWLPGLEGVASVEVAEEFEPSTTDVRHSGADVDDLVAASHPTRLRSAG